MSHLIRQNLIYIGLASGMLMSFALARLMRLAFQTPTLTFPQGGNRGERRRAACRSSFFRMLDPILRGVGHWVKASLTLLRNRFPSLGVRIAKWEEQQKMLLICAGEPLGLERHEAIALSVLLGIFGAAAGLILGRSSGTLVWVLPGALFLASLPNARFQSIRNDRFSEMGRELPTAIDLIALAMNAGCDFPGAIRRVIEGQRGVVADELRQVLRSLELGITRSAALLALRERIPIQEVRDLVRAVLLAEKKGASVTEALIQQARASRQRRSVRAEEAAARAGVLMLFPLMLLMICILIMIVGPIVSAGGLG